MSTNTDPVLGQQPTQHYWTLPDFAQRVKEENPNAEDMDDATVASWYLHKFPEAIHNLHPDDAPLAYNLVNGIGGADTIRNFYKAFNQDVMKDVDLNRGMPEFVQPAIKNARIVMGNPGSDAAAQVKASEPNTVFVDRPEIVDRPMLGHESTHIYQLKLRDPMRADPAGSSGRGSAEINYEYGGWQGLLDAQAKHKTIRDYSDEQQAEMVGDYMALQDRLLKYPDVPKWSGIKTPQAKQEYYQHLLSEWDLANRALAPFIHQLATQPKRDEPQGGAIDMRPRPPGPPPAALTGAAIPLEEMGGRAAFLDGLVSKAQVKNRKQEAQPAR